jgi:hypothetical protein
MELGGRFWLGLVGIVLAIGVGGFIAFLIVGAAWYAWGALGALVFIFAVIGALAWLGGRRRQKQYDAYG